MLILVRHGQTQANADGRLLGRADPPLTELGRRQACAIADIVARDARVVSSPLVRARDTAAALGLPVEVDDRWIEVDYGEFEGERPGDVPSDVWRRWREDPDFVPGGGESLEDVARRVRAACESLSTEAVEREVVVVSHVSPIKAAVAWALGVGPSVAWRTYLDVASVCRIAIGPHGPTLLTFNETSHLGTLRQ